MGVMLMTVLVGAFIAVRVSEDHLPWWQLLKQ